jgi:hypothetical protein
MRRYIARIERRSFAMSFRCRELGVNLSRELLDFCPTASASLPLVACGQVTRFCPTASATGDFRSTIEIDLEPLRAQMREALRNHA